MKKSRFTEHQIVSVLNDAEASIAVKDVCRRHGISSPTYYKWNPSMAVCRLRASSGSGSSRPSCRSTSYTGAPTPCHEHPADKLNVVLFMNVLVTMGK